MNSYPNVVYAYDFEDVDNYDYNYQYDGSCGVMELSSGVRYSEKIYGANVFTIKGGSQCLDAVSFYTTNVNMKYSIQIYKVTEEGNPIGTALLDSPIEGTEAYLGYHTVKLNEGIILEDGETFSVVIKYTDTNPTISGATVFADISYSNDYMEFVAAFEEGQSYYCTDGINWKDCANIQYNVGTNEEPEIYTGFNLRIKAFTNKIPVDGVVLSGGGTIGVGDSMEVLASISPSYATNQKVSWESSNEAIATVDEKGIVTGVSAGETIITATTEDGGFSSSCVIKVMDKFDAPSKPVLSKRTDSSITIQKQAGCEYSIDGENWQDSNMFTDLKPGTEYKVYARMLGDEYYYTSDKSEALVVKTYSKISGVSLDKKEITVVLGETGTVQLKAAVTPTDIMDNTVKWSSSAETVATVTASESDNAVGNVTVKAIGETNIVATTNGNSTKSASCHITVYKKQDKPSAPTLTSKTHNSVTLGKVSGCEYSKDGVNWQSSNVFTGLSAETAYTFFMRRAEDKASYLLASWASGGLTVTTDKESVSGDTGGLTGNTGSSTGSTGGSTGNTGGSTGSTGGSTGNTGGSTSGSTGSTGNSGGEGTAIPFVAPKINVNYRTHIQTYGWEGEDDDIKTWESNGSMSGTSGESKRLEGINIVVNPATNCPDLDLGIQYTTHCQSYGWLPWSADGDMNGTSGESKRLEAIMIQLTGEHADYYDVYYRVHAQNYGWLGWAKNGEAAGTAGYSKRLEGIQIVVVKKGEDFNRNAEGIESAYDIPFDAKEGSSPIVNYPSTSNTNPIVPGTEDVNVSYRTHVQTYGWQGWKYNGQMSGTSGESKRLEGIEIKLTNRDCEGGIAYATHVQTYGWQGADLDNPATWRQDGQMAGTHGESKRLEAICIALTGEMADNYDIYYRVHAQTYGWLGWAKNGAPAGTAGLSRRLEGIQIVVVPKGANGPVDAYMGITSANQDAYIEK
ncbi:MAG: Ig-like domain-containing protein [Lachnospiraceae bacterium]|nr:Ig-like domain-containing protein [Lachnospiraceae bacterium]